MQEAQGRLTLKRIIDQPEQEKGIPNGFRIESKLL
jgi:hypothetical protein